MIKIRNFEVNATTNIRANIKSREIARIINKECVELLGGRDRYIQNGIIREDNMRWRGDIREATNEEIELYNAFCLVEKYFKSLD